MKLCFRTSTPMIHFCLAHTAYHLHRWLPRPHRLRLQVTVFLFGTTALGLQLYVLLRPRSARYCRQPLLTNLVGNIIFTFFTIGLNEITGIIKKKTVVVPITNNAIGFAVLLTWMEPVPQALERMFAVFGVGSFGEGVCTVVLTVLATDCEKTSPELYYLSVLLSVGSVVSTVLFSGLGLTWLGGGTRARPDAKAMV